jgi:predicted metal-dependent hydrolase
MFPYLGMTYPLKLVEGGREPLSLDGESFKLAVSYLSDAASVFERWYRGQARQVLTGRVEFFARQHDFHYQRIRITSARTRWGSCSSTGSLSFSWRLIQAPSAVVDYVVVHELVHTVFHNHSQHFWNLVEMIMPDYQDHRRWLKEHARELLL